MTANFNKFRQIKRAFRQTDVSTQNMLYPSLYDYISSSKVRNLIMDTDLSKFKTRCEIHALKQRTISKEEKKIFGANWRLELNQLHIDKRFIGNLEKRSAGVISNTFMHRIKDLHGINAVPTFTGADVGGFGSGEMSFAVFFDKHNKVRIRSISCSQNRRNCHLGIRLQNFFGGAGGFETNVWGNSSSINWKNNSKKQNILLIAPKMKEVIFHFPLKDLEKDLFLQRIKRQTEGLPHMEIRSRFGISKNKHLLRPDTEKAIPDISPRWLVRRFDAEGSILKNGANRYFNLRQKDPYWRACVQKHFGNKSYQKVKSYQIDYKKNFNKIDRLFNLCYPARTDFAFKYEYLKHCGLVELDNLRKLPEYVPSRRQIFHRLKRQGEVLPDRLLEVLDTYYPMELILYYKDIYNNICHKYGMSRAVLPFTDFK